MSIATQIHTWLFGTYRGVDEFGNKYYSSNAKRGKRERRWVIYKGLAEPSKIPPEWHSWLHYLTDTPPNADTRKELHAWQKPHIPNLTGTPKAYYPPGHIKAGGKREHATGDYEAWRP